MATNMQTYTYETGDPNTSNWRNANGRTEYSCCGCSRFVPADEAVGNTVEFYGYPVCFGCARTMDKVSPHTNG